MPRFILVLIQNIFVPSPHGGCLTASMNPIYEGCDPIFWRSPEQWYTMHGVYGDADGRKGPIHIAETLFMLPFTLSGLQHSPVSQETLLVRGRSGHHSRCNNHNLYYTRGSCTELTLSKALTTTHEISCITVYNSSPYWRNVPPPLKTFSVGPAYGRLILLGGCEVESVTPGGEQHNQVCSSIPT